ncbi:hypothetical protein [Roseateles sp. BYS87W]|uniref:Uncharacterized protein n=1 Tax=Pelomonas baiyunensis TaxID=3299026 RepID=A0ABW7H006_9BURK
MGDRYSEEPHVVAENSHDELLKPVAESLCTRALTRFAEEARLDGESRMDAVERYEVDCVWHVLGSDRMRNETVALLDAKLKHPATDVQKTCVAEVLRTAAVGQSPDLLMSFDSDAPNSWLRCCAPQHGLGVRAEVEAVS